VDGVESLERLWNPVSIAFDAAIGVAFVGLVVNGASMFLLANRQHEHHDHDHDHHHHDHNLRSAYLHVLADTLTSVLAIIALLAGRYMGWVWLDPVMGLVGAGLITRWAWGLVKDTSRVLLGYQAPAAHVEAVKQSLERVDSNVVTDLHLWAIGPGIYALSAAIVTHAPRPIGSYGELLPQDLGIVHTTFEIHRCEGSGTGC
jgi:cation diffusion facilitator family transporter